MSADTSAPHTPSDDPRVRELHHALCAAWAKPTPSTRPTDDEARDLLARLDAAAPARDDALARWLDTEIAEAERITRSRADGDLHLSAAVSQNRASTLREVRDRLGATTNTTPEEGTDD